MIENMSNKNGIKRSLFAKNFPIVYSVQKSHKNFESYDFLYGNHLLVRSNKKNNKVQNCRSGDFAKSPDHNYLYYFAK